MSLPFGTKRIPYDKIEDVKSYTLPSINWRHFGISFIGGRFSNKDLGKFYAVYGGKKKGILIQAPKETIYGGTLYITPKHPSDFVRTLTKVQGGE